MDRRSFLAVAASAAAAPTAGATENVPGGRHLVERHADFDERTFASLVGRPAQIRQVYEATAFKPGVLDNIKNSFNGLEFGFGYAVAEIAIVLAPHGPSSVYAYRDTLWRKYRLGEFFKLSDAGGRAVSSNAYLAKRSVFDPVVDPDDEAGMYQDASIEMLQRRGLIVLTCHTAVEEQARALVRAGFAPSGMTALDVAGDILTQLIAGAVVVPSMVATIAVLQATYRYTYLTPQ